jgi:hypothetical protein
MDYVMTKKRLVLNKRARSVIRVAASGLAAGALAVIGIVVAGHATIRPRLLALTSIVLAARAFCAPRWISAGRYDGTLRTATECVGGGTSVTQWPYSPPAEKRF